MSHSYRERKKQHTRQALIDGAYALFRQKGYDNTTLAEICAAADCAPRTFFRYFSAKEDLLLVGIDELWADLRVALLERPKGTTTLQALEQWSLRITHGYLNNHHPLMDVLNREVANAGFSAESRKQLYSMSTMQAVLIPEFAKDLRLSPEDTEPRLMAAATAAMFDAHHSDIVLAKKNEIASLGKIIRLLDGAMNSARLPD